MDREPEETYTVQEAARILRTTERTVRRRLERGDLDGRRDPTSGRWRVTAHSVTAAMANRPAKASQEAPEASQEAADLRTRVRGPAAPPRAPGGTEGTGGSGAVHTPGAARAGA